MQPSYRVIITGFLFLAITAIYSQAGSLASGSDVAAPLDNKQLHQKPVFTNLNEALKKPSEVFRLNLRAQQIDSLPLELGSLINLHELVLDSTYIRHLPETIGQLARLTTISIQHLENPNQHLNRMPQSLQNLSNLQSVNLIGNPQLDFSAVFRALSSSERLVNIALMKNNFNKLPGEIRQLQSLEMIWLGQNPGLDIADAFEKLSANQRIAQIGFGGCKFNIIPDNISKLPNLESIWLANNNFQKFPTWPGLVHLKALTLRNNDIREFPENKKPLQSLEYLDLNGNKHLNLEQLFDFLSSFPNLKSLTLNNTGISTLPESLAQLQSLERISVKKNKFTKTAIENLKRQFPKIEFSF